MLNFAIGFLVAILSGLGIGGGGLLVIWLVLGAGTEQLAAQGINLYWFLFSSSAAMLVHLMKRRLSFKLIGYLVFFGVIGSLFGSLLLKAVSPDIIRKIFGGLLIFSGVLTLIGKKK